MKKTILSLFLVLNLICLCSCTGGKIKNEIEPLAYSSFEYFDTRCTIFSFVENDDDFEKNCSEILSLLEKYHRLFDIYYEYAGINNLKTVNMYAAERAIEIDGELMDFLVYAKKMYTLSGGEMNIAIGALTSLWHDARSEAENETNKARIPSRQELSEASQHISIDDLILDEANMTVRFADAKMSLDVGAVAKGYAVEKIAEHLRGKGISSYVLNVGGNICAIGEKPYGGGWVTGITNPDKSSDEPFVARIELADTSCVTSGNYERYYTVDNKRYHHIIDSKTMMPADYFASVTVITEDSGLADVLSTALFCMSYENGLSLVSTLDGVEVLWVYEDNSIRMTDGFKDILID